MSDQEKQIRWWRISATEGQPGLHVWFDPAHELLTLRDLTEAEKSATLDEPGSVSALRLFRDYAEVIDGCTEGPLPEGPLHIQLDLLHEETDNEPSH